MLLTKFSLAPSFVSIVPSLLAFIEVKQLTYLLFIRLIVISFELVATHRPFSVTGLKVVIQR